MYSTLQEHCYVCNFAIMTKQTEKCLDAYDAHDRTKLLNDRAKFEVPGHLTAQPLNLILTSEHM